MRTKLLFLIIFGCTFLMYPELKAQINPLKKIKDKTNEQINKGIDKSFDKAFNKKDKDKEVKKENSAVQNTPEDSDAHKNEPKLNSASESKTAAPGRPELKWSKYDFVPGDKIIFEDNQLHEENGEFPSRWDLFQGTTENAVFGNDNVIMFRGGAATIVPYMKNSNTDYLPDVFTVEFDLYLPNNSINVNFWDRKNQTSPRGATYLNIWGEGMELSPARSNLPNKENINSKWAHIAIAYTNGKMKAYINETRLINIPHLEFNPIGITLHSYHASDSYPVYIKNFRIAEGGVKYYDRFLQDGKIVSNAIRFDVGKATLLPESMGAVNEIYSLLEEHPEVKFSIEGHTDSDGDFDLNQKLSEERAKTVMDQLISMGIEKNRLSFRGFGETTPIDANDTPEGKASNRRVEFVKTN
ncbi:MAG: OmpA family protein [Bacteroidales bacterium]|nr:OmpA family protein [Bacteroidales bacterium]MCF8389984.1 OmpA family protein [Bacteroidales bacterium]